MPSLLTDAQKSYFDAAMADQFDTFKRGFAIYVSAQTAVISTSLTYSRFGPHSQDTPVSADNMAVTPQFSVISGCILYDDKQPWVYSTPGGKKSDTQELKLRESDGIVRIKVDATGNALLSQCKLVNLDGFDFQLDSTARPHGLVGSPTRWTYTLERQL